MSEQALSVVLVTKSTDSGAKGESHLNDASSRAILEVKVDTSGLFQTRVGEAWINRTACDVCHETHITHKVQVVTHSKHEEHRLRDAVRLSDGTLQVDIMYESTCIDEPFRNIAKSLSKSLNMRIASAHQVFDSIEQLSSLLSFSVPGEFFDWDEPRLSVSEQYEEEMGHLLKLNYQGSPESELLDVVIEFEEFEHVASDYLGEKVRGFGVEITISGSDASLMEETSTVIQGVLDDYARLLAPATSGE